MCTLGWFKDQWGLLDGCKKLRRFSWRVLAQACLLPLPAQRQQAENCLVCPGQLARATPVKAAVCTRALAPAPPAPALLLTRQQPLSHTRRSQGSHKAPQSRGRLPPAQEECELPQDCSRNPSGPDPTPGQGGNHSHAEEKLRSLRTATPALRIWPHAGLSSDHHHAREKPSFLGSLAPAPQTPAWQRPPCHERSRADPGLWLQPSSASIAPHQRVSHK